MADMLILGNDAVASQVGHMNLWSKLLGASALTLPEQFAVHAFMLSHFVADCCMPCHCDARALASTTRGKLHGQIEGAWKKMVCDYFEDTSLCGTADAPATIIAKACALDTPLGVTFGASVPSTVSADAWLEAVMLCRASFAVASALAPPSSYPYDRKLAPSFKEIFAQPNPPVTFAAFTSAMLHDAVMNTAMIWRQVWERVR